MEADDYKIDDEEMELMIRSMNTDSETQKEYVEDEHSQEFDWGKMNEALGEQVPSMSKESTNTSPKTTDPFCDMTPLREEIELEEERKRAQQEQDRLKRKKEQEATEKTRRRRIKFRPPGNNIFLTDDCRQEPFRFFSYKNLSLVKDFGYNVKHKERGYGCESQLMDIFSDPVKFIMHLSPETTSNLIHDKDDFEKICDYLFFSLASFYEDSDDKYEIATFEHFDMFKKALFDLLRNYGFSSFRLRPKYILECLLNLGFNEKILLNKEQYINALSDRISNVKEWYKKNKSKTYTWSLPRFHDFFIARQKEPQGAPSTAELEKTYKAFHTDEEDEDCSNGNSRHEKMIIENKQQIVDSEKSRIPCRSELLRLQQIECIENFVELFSDLIITFTEDPYVR